MAQALEHEGWPWGRLVPVQRAAEPATGQLPAPLACALHLPFDALRGQHALAVRTGLIARSMLESRDFERSMDALERAALGILARRV
jgi:hypothetical protein